jgi:DNA-binding response OmpR family regulator
MRPRPRARRSEQPASPDSATYRLGDSPRTLVLVDDHDDLRHAIAEALSHAGWIVRAFATPEEAHSSIRDEPPDAVLTDFNAGRLTGPGLAREVRADRATRGVVLVGMSGSIDPSARMLSLFDLFLPKPVDLTRLDGVLRRLIDR